MLLDGACQRLFGNDSAQHQRLAYASASAPPCQPRPTPLGPAAAPAAPPTGPTVVVAQAPPTQGYQGAPPTQGYPGAPPTQYPGAPPMQYPGNTVSLHTMRPAHAEPPGIPQPGSGDML
jgi:hypothetical protein